LNVYRFTALNSCAQSGNCNGRNKDLLHFHECLTEHEWTLERILELDVIVRIQVSQYEQQHVKKPKSIAVTGYCFNYLLSKVLGENCFLNARVLLLVRMHMLLQCAMT